MPSLLALVEACVTSPEEAAACFALGVQRAELCRALDVGGLTPPDADIAEAVARRAAPVVVLVRPEAGPFRLTPAATAALVDEVARIAALGVDGLVVGALDRRGHVDAAALGELVQAAAGLPVTFHRAFDEVADPLREVAVLLRSGVARLLTSGGAATAWQGRQTLRALVAETAGRLTVIGAGRVRGDHARALVEETGLTDVHARAAAIPGVVAALKLPG